MQGIVTKVERSGHVLRTPHPEHGRIQTPDLTETGRATLEAAHAVAAQIEALARTAADPLDPNTVTATLLRVAGALRSRQKPNGFRPPLTQRGGPKKRR